MILIADSGSTKTDWILTESKDKWKGYSTVGYNPYFVDMENIYVSIRESLLPHLEGVKIDELHFYGAGCSTAEHRDTVRKALIRAFSDTKTIVVDHDMLAAARALLGRSAGFAAILGTGCNTCTYDGKKITLIIDSLGYLLGDEGSGAYIGRKILQNYMRRYFDADISKKFVEKHLSENEDIFKALYGSPLINRYLASYASFAGENKDHPQIQAIVRSCFTDFFNNLVAHYPNYKNYSFNCIGTIGYIFKEILAEVSESFEMKVGDIVRKPIEGLIKYHYEMP